MSELETTPPFAGRVDCVNVDATQAEPAEYVKSLGFKNHGLEIKNGAGESVFKQPDHEVDMEAVKKRLRELIDR